MLSFTDTSVTVSLTPPDSATVFDSLSVRVCEAAGAKTCKDPVACSPAPVMPNTACTVTVSGLTAATAYTATASAVEGSVTSVVGPPVTFTTRYT